MSLLEIRGGFPHVFRETISTAGRSHHFKFDSKYLQARAGTSPCKLYFKEADFDADANYVLIPVSTDIRWEGPVEIREIWLKGDGGNSELELVAYQRRG